MSEKIWQEYAVTLKEVLGLADSPVAVSCIHEALEEPPGKKVRICKSILEAAKGAIFKINKANNLCFGASWHLGFHRIRDPKIEAMVKKFVVEGEKLFCSYEALDSLMSQMEPVPDNSEAYFLLSPMEKAQALPEIVIFVVNAEGACRLLTFVTFFDGAMPKIKIGGPTCRMAIMYPLQSQEVNLSFYDQTARKLCAMDKDKLIITLPYSMIPKIIQSLDTCSGGRAKIEFPAEFRVFLQKRLTPGQVK